MRRDRLVSLAAGRHPDPRSLSTDERHQFAEHALARALHQETLIAFTGAGCSAGLRGRHRHLYPTWQGLIAELLHKALAEPQTGHEPELLRLYKDASPDVMPADLNGVNQVAADLCRDALGEQELNAWIRWRFEPQRRLAAERANPYRDLLDLGVTRFITTNYDVELERAIFRFGTRHRHDYSADELGLDDYGATAGRNNQKQRVDGAPGREPSFETSDLSFTQRSDPTKLARFGLAKAGLAKAGTEGMVFHCHGRFDDPKSLVVGERDYQRWYLETGTRELTPFLQTLRFALTSNPILFVGYGLGDGDLLRPLRMLHARSQSVKQYGKLFVLAPVPDGDRNRFRVQSSFFWAKYGILAIPFLHEGKDPTARDLCRELQRLKQRCEELREDWLGKPPIRRVVVRPQSGDGSTRAYLHSHLPTDKEASFDRAAEEWADRIFDSTHEVFSKKCVFLFVGDGGFGKSWRALEILKEVRRQEAVAGVFFWSSYYADDCLSGMQRAILFMEACDRLRGDPAGTLARDHATSDFDWFVKLLSSDRYLLIFDGIERLLRPTETPGDGRAYRRSVTRFLAAITRIHPGQSRVILTSRLQPSLYKELPVDDGADDADRPNLERVHVTAVGPVDIRGLATREVFSEMDEKRREELYALLDGHAYALALAQALLRPPGGARQVPALDERTRVLCASLSHTPPERRVSRMIAEALGAVEKAFESQTGYRGAARLLLEHAALFMSPIDKAGLAVCCLPEFKAARSPGAGSANAEEALSEVIRRLVAAKLLFEIEREAGVAGASTSEPSPPGEREHEPQSLPAFAVHPLVREYVYSRLHDAPAEALPNFALTGVTSSTSNVYPGNQDAVAMVTKTIDRLLRKCRKSAAPGRSELLRSAFGAVRSRMEANTAARWCTHDKYFNEVVRIADAARALSRDQLWHYASDPGRTDGSGGAQPAGLYDISGVLYADELAWLYNDLGLSLCLEGSVRDAYDLWEQGFAINRAVDDADGGGQYIVQSLLHMGHTFIEIGNLQIAENYLLRCRRQNQRLGGLQDRDYERRITGYLGLIAHLQGHWRRAISSYRFAVHRNERTSRRESDDPLDESDPGGDRRRPFNAVEPQNDRSDAIFLRHFADLQTSLNNLDESERLLRLSRAHAEHGGHEDLLGYAKNTEGHIYRLRGNPREANRAYEAALAVARKRGIRKLEAEVLSEQSRLALVSGDTESARLRALQSLSIANELGLGLRQTHGLVVVGLATRAAGQPALGEAYLALALRLANLQSYWARKQEIEAELMPVPADDEADNRRERRALPARRQGHYLRRPSQ